MADFASLNIFVTGGLGFIGAYEAARPPALHCRSAARTARARPRQLPGFPADSVRAHSIARRPASAPTCKTAPNAPRGAPRGRHLPRRSRCPAACSRPERASAPDAGSHTVLVLLEHGCTVTLIDNLSNSFPRVFEHMTRLAGDKADKMKYAKVGCPRSESGSAPEGGLRPAAALGGRACAAWAAARSRQQHGRRADAPCCAPAVRHPRLRGPRQAVHRREVSSPRPPGSAAAGMPLGRRDEPPLPPSVAGPAPPPPGGRAPCAPPPPNLLNSCPCGPTGSTRSSTLRASRPSASRWPSRSSTTTTTLPAPSPCSTSCASTAART
jgi:hypothetical protein